MKTLLLRGESARVPVPEKLAWKKWFSNDEMTKITTDGVSRHIIANSVLVLCGYAPMNKELLEVMPSASEIYTTITNTETSVAVDIDHVVRETCTTFKSEGANTGAGKSGVYDKRWFAARFLVGRNPVQYDIVEEFHQWLRANFPDDPIGSFSSLMGCFETKVMLEIYNKGTAEEWLQSFLPSKFHVFSPLLRDSYYVMQSKEKRLKAIDSGKTRKFSSSGMLSKHITRPYFVRPNGKVYAPSNSGSVVLTGGPRVMLNSDFTVEVGLPDYLYYRILREKNNGPGYASICDGGVCWIVEEEE